jgi:hypothetical protein
MIFLMFLVGFGVWLAAAIVFCKRIPRWLGVSKHGAVISVLLFPVVLALPVADDLIGRWQFYRLCDMEAVVTLSPDWEKVKRARRVSSPRSDVAGALIPIYSQGSEYVDADTGKTFMTHPHFYTYGGLLFGRLGLGLGSSTSCHPKNSEAVAKQINIYELLKQGEMK